ncbi:hypothetical protein DEI99_005285 [Curtobacterium sp. MCLR17_036]|uniref:hypothetical protein n=1 Tax=Curtobacterium sp. MCLR17_036 TaxID=2175620 RepID=UPI000DA87E91|nr:hypothetical protein [Curtobacterium sp. MCLR17_036]WIE65953.1 hypothetical protein DEI99_005285 [Curtobacterium sp. MCLR17_036]
MYGVIYGDFLAHLIARLDAFLTARTESYAAGVTVSNRKGASGRRAVVLTASPGGGTGNTLRTSYVTVDVVTDDEGTAVDLINLVLALATSRGPGGMVDGRPITAAEINGGPNSDPAADGFFKQTAELELQHRGRNL